MRLFISVYFYRLTARKSFLTFLPPTLICHGLGKKQMKQILKRR
jgi:hypothetical protein